MNRLTVYAMGEKGYHVVDALLSHHAGLVECIVGASDPNVEKDWRDEIESRARAAGVTYRDRRTERSAGSSHALAVAWRWMIDAGQAQLVVMHDSLLPKYRGFNPLVTALIEGDERIGVTALRASHEYDRGEILASAAPVRGARSRADSPLSSGSARYGVPTSLRAPTRPS